MKEIFNTLKANPKEAAVAAVTVAVTMAGFWAVIWIGSAIGLQ
jgi:hypothetical protein